MLNVERIFSNSLWAVWVAMMARRPDDAIGAWPSARHREEAEGRLYSDQSFLPGW